MMVKEYLATHAHILHTQTPIHTHTHTHTHTITERGGDTHIHTHIHHANGKLVIDVNKPVIVIRYQPSLVNTPMANNG